MTRYGILALATLAFAFCAAAQNSPSSQPNAAVQAQTSASATASASSSQQNPSTAEKKDAPGASRSASASASSGTSASANAGNSSLNISSGTDIEAMLVTPLDAKHNKPGDPVMARTTRDVKQDGQVVLKKGSQLDGHVTQAEGRTSKNSQSSLGVVFDSAVPKNSKQHVPLNMSVQALAASAAQTSAAIGDEQAALGGGASGGAVGSVAPAGGLGHGVGGAVGGVANTTGNVVGNVGQPVNGTVGAATRTVASAGSTGGLNAAGELTSASSGVFGLQGLNLTSAASSGTQASVVNSTSRNVHLDSGTQMVLQVVKQ